LHPIEGDGSSGRSQTKVLALPFPDDCVRVLVVDDERAIADSLARILRNHGFHAIAEYSARGAVQAVRNFIPHVLITDIIMPEVSGIDLAEWFTKAHPACRIFLTSANFHSLDSNDLGFEHSGEIAFLPKPMRISELLEQLRRQSAA
jgi:DNA-binding NtrC family response regulator